MRRKLIKILYFPESHPSHLSNSDLISLGGRDVLPPFCFSSADENKTKNNNNITTQIKIKNSTYNSDNNNKNKMGNRVEDFIALVTLLVVVVLVGTVGRLWILRHRPRTFAVNLSDCAFLLFSVLMMVAAGMAYDGVDKELKIQRAYGAEGIERRLLTPKYLKVGNIDFGGFSCFK
jgi:hypothetical protein